VIVLLEDQYPPGSIEEGLLEHRGPGALASEDQYDAALIGARPDDRSGQAFGQRPRSASEQGLVVSGLVASREPLIGGVGHQFGLSPSLPFPWRRPQMDACT
jgi:hypothetical protein